MIADVFKIDRECMMIIWKKLGASVTFVNGNLTSLADYGQIDESGVATGVVGDVLRGKYEIFGFQDYQRGLWRDEVNTYTLTGLCFVTRKEMIPVFEQLMKAFPWEMQLVFVIFALLITIMFTYLLRISCVEVTVDVLRVVLGVPMHYKPTSKLRRIIIAFFILTFMIVGTYVQSQLSVMFTILSKYEGNIRTRHDLAKAGYKIFGESYYQQYLERSIFNDTGYVDSVPECLELIKTDAKMACVSDCYLLRHIMYENSELHISKDELFDRFNVYLTRHDSPLRERIEMMYSFLFQHGIIQHLFKMGELSFRKPLCTGFTRISLYRLRYAFYFLLATLVFCALVFFIEIGTRIGFGQTKVEVDGRREFFRIS